MCSHGDLLVVYIIVQCMHVHMDISGVGNIVH